MKISLPSAAITITNSYSPLRSCWRTAQRVIIQKKIGEYSFFDRLSKQRTKKSRLLCLKKHNIFNIFKKIFFTIHKFESINCHQFIFPHKKSFLRVKTSSFSLLVWVGNFLQNIRDGHSLVTSNRLTNLARRLLVHNLLVFRYSIKIFCEQLPGSKYTVRIRSYCDRISL